MYKKKSPSEGLFEANNEMQSLENVEKTERKPVTLNIKKPEKEAARLPQKREIERVIVFYTDKTFREYDAEP